MAANTNTGLPASSFPVQSPRKFATAQDAYTCSIAAKQLQDCRSDLLCSSDFQQKTRARACLVANNNVLQQRQMLAYKKATKARSRFPHLMTGYLRHLRNISDTPNPKIAYYKHAVGEHYANIKFPPAPHDGLEQQRLAEAADGSLAQTELVQQATASRRTPKQLSKREVRLARAVRKANAARWRARRKPRRRARRQSAGNALRAQTLLPTPAAELPVTELPEKMYNLYPGNCVTGTPGRHTPARGRIDSVDSPAYGTVLERVQLPYNHGIAKTFALLDYPHHFKTRSPVDTAQDAWRGEVLACLVDGGHHATTAHSFVYTMKEMAMLLARCGALGSSARSARGAVDPLLLLDFRSGAPTDASAAPVHSNEAQWTQWTSVTPEGLLVPTHNENHLELRVDIQVKSFAGADSALIEASGISYGVFDAIRQMYWNAAGAGKTASSEDAFLCQSTLYAVRAIGTLVQAPEHYRRCPFLLGMGGWVAPPRYWRHMTREEEVGDVEYVAMETKVEDVTMETELEDVAIETGEVVDVAMETDDETDVDDDVAMEEPPNEPANALPFPQALAKLEALVARAGLFDRDIAARQRNIVKPLAKQLGTPRTLSSMAVHPDSIAAAKDLPRPPPNVHLRADPQNIQYEIRQVPRHGAAMPGAAVWRELADPTLEDVLWMTHRLMTSKGMAHFPAARSDFGINWDIAINLEAGRQQAWQATCLFASPSPMAKAHSHMLWTAYNNGVLDMEELYRR